MPVPPNDFPFSSLIASGVFFTVCMALLVLSLSKSILLIKFLHLGEDPVRERLFFCCCVGSAVDRGCSAESFHALGLQAAGDVAGTCGFSEPPVHIVL